MKNCILLLTILLVVTCTQAQVIFSIDTSVVSNKKFKRDGVLAHMNLYNNRDLFMRIDYYADSTIKYVANYTNNKLNGPTFTYYKNGKTRSVENYWNGIPVGAQSFWYENGVLEREEIYAIDSSEYPSAQYDTIMIVYKNEPMHVITWEYPNYPTGVWKYYTLNGTLEKEETYRKGKLVSAK